MTLKFAYDGARFYAASWCRDCRAAKQFLEAHGVQYTEINVDSDPAASDEVFRTWASAPFRNW
jgi:arsenate reductase-like glutaredoxin family protein